MFYCVLTVSKTWLEAHTIGVPDTSTFLLHKKETSWSQWIDGWMDITLLRGPSQHQSFVAFSSASDQVRDLVGDEWHSLRVCVAGAHWTSPRWTLQETSRMFWTFSWRGCNSDNFCHSSALSWHLRVMFLHSQISQNNRLVWAYCD